MTPEQSKRIEQFRNMAESDPNNELGHFSLGKAYLEAEKFADAVKALTRALQLDPTLSKAWQYCGEAHLGGGDKSAAIDAWTRGVEVADEAGDRVPRDAMVARLQSLNASVPKLRAVAPKGQIESSSESSAGFRCVRCG